MFKDFLIVAGTVIGFFVGRNNPSLAAVNTLIAKGKAVISKAGNIVKTIK